MNNSHAHNFIRWFLVSGAVAVMCFLAQTEGVFRLIVTKDASYLALTTMILFVCGSLYAGLVSHRLDKGTLNPNTVKKPLKILSFLSGTFFTLGLLGTIVGFCLMMSKTIEGQKEAQEIINSLKIGLGTALYTTLVGIITCLLLDFEIFLIEYYNEENKEKSTINIDEVNKVLNGIPAITKEDFDQLEKEAKMAAACPSIVMEKVRAPRKKSEKAGK